MHADIFAASAIGAVGIVHRALRAGDEVGCMDRVRFLCVLLLVEVEEHPIARQYRPWLKGFSTYHFATLTLTCSALESNL